MNEKQIDELFKTMPFNEAKAKLIDFLKSNGEELTGNEMIFELKSKCVNMQSNTAKAQQMDFVIPEPDKTSTPPPTCVDPDSALSAAFGATQEPNAEPDVDAVPEPTQEPTVEPDAEPDAEPKKRRGRRRKADSGEPDNSANPLEECAKSMSAKKDEVNKKMEELKKAQEELEKLKAEEERLKAEEEEKRRQEEEKRKQAMQNCKDHAVLDEVVKRLKCLGKAFLVGPAGTGKSTLAINACAKIFDIEGGIEGVMQSDKFAQISFSPDTVSADMLGFKDVNGVFHETDIIRVFRDGGLILFDEMDDADASLLVKLNTMLANRVIPTPNGMVVQNDNTYIVGTANTYGKGGNSMYVGRNRLDAATLDRWKMATINVNYDTKLEHAIIDSGISDTEVASSLKNICSTIRNTIESNCYKQICSTRFVIDAVKMVACGYNLKQVVNTFLLDWGLNEAKTVKLAVKEYLK